MAGSAAGLSLSDLGGLCRAARYVSEVSFRRAAGAIEFRNSPRRATGSNLTGVTACSMTNTARQSQADAGPSNLPGVRKLRASDARYAGTSPRGFGS